MEVNYPRLEKDLKLLKLIENVERINCWISSRAKVKVSWWWNLITFIAIRNRIYPFPSPRHLYSLALRGRPDNLNYNLAEELNIKLHYDVSAQTCPRWYAILMNGLVFENTPPGEPPCQLATTTINVLISSFHFPFVPPLPESNLASSSQLAQVLL